jgi:peptidoglycan-associated lipoprotein
VKADDSAIRSILTQMAFFQYDRSELSDQDQSTLAAKVPILAANPAVSIRVAGNCDDRGSDEYNLALGQRRAQSAKRYLTEHGIADTQISVISYGKERPISSGDTEAAWAQNRNDQFEITSSGDLPRGRIRRTRPIFPLARHRSVRRTGRSHRYDGRAGRPPTRVDDPRSVPRPPRRRELDPGSELD